MPEPTKGTGTTWLTPILARPGWRRWILLVAFATLLPKCLVCVAGYLALGGGLVTATAELCGAAADDTLPARGAGVTGLIILAGGLWLNYRQGPRRQARSCAGIKR